MNVFTPPRSEPKRVKRSDCLEKACPVAIETVKEFIYNRTQPSPCSSVTKHNFGVGNHSRSEADGSLVCNHPDLCPTKNVRYMMEPKVDLWSNCMGDLKAAVSTMHRQLDIEAWHMCVRHRQLARSTER